MRRRRFVQALALAGLYPVWRLAMSDAFPVLADDGTAFVTKTELAAQLQNYLALSGGFMRGPIDMGGQRIAEGVFSTASSGERFEMTREDRNRLYMYSGEDVEQIAGRLVFDAIEGGGVFTPRVDIQTAGLTASGSQFGQTKFTLGGAASDDSVHGSFTLSSDQGLSSNVFIRGLALDATGTLEFEVDGTDSYITFDTNDLERFRIAHDGKVTGTFGDYHVSSDRRLKENIEPIEDALGKVNQLQGVTYCFIDGDGNTKMGLIYQDVEPIVPEVTNTYDKDGEEYGAVEYDKLVPLLIEAVKTLTARVEELEAQ